LGHSEDTIKAISLQKIGYLSNCGFRILRLPAERITPNRGCRIPVCLRTDGENILNGCDRDFAVDEGAELDIGNPHHEIRNSLLVPGEFEESARFDEPGFAINSRCEASERRSKYPSCTRSQATREPRRWASAKGNLFRRPSLNLKVRRIEPCESGFFEIHFRMVWKRNSQLVLGVLPTAAREILYL